MEQCLSDGADVYYEMTLVSSDYYCTDEDDHLSLITTLYYC